MTTKTKPQKSTATDRPNPAAKSPSQPLAKPAAPPETASQRARRIREQKAAVDKAEFESLGKLRDSTEGLQALIGGRVLLKRSDYVAWTNSEWNELEEVCRKFRPFMQKLTLIQCELIARTQMKTSCRQLVGLPKTWHVWTDAENPTFPAEIVDI